jgi:uncharacterized OB-fold protein
MSGNGPVIPRPDELDLELYRSIVAGGRLHTQRCRECGTYSHPPRYHCPSCFARAYEFAPVSGRGKVYSYTVSHFSVEPAWRDKLPYLTVVVELDEGVRVVGAARGLDPDDVAFDTPVRVVAEPHGEDFAFLWVEPAGDVT